MRSVEEERALPLLSFGFEEASSHSYLNRICPGRAKQFFRNEYLSVGFHARLHSRRAGERDQVKDADRLFHLHLVGKTGTRKSTLLKTLMQQQDLSRGHGFALLDPHGDLCEEVLDSVPRSRLQDVVC